MRLEGSETKNKEAGTVYLDGELKEIFKQQWEARSNNAKLLPYVFPNKQGTDRLKSFRKVWTKACRGAKIGNRLFYDFRRTAVRDMVRSGVPERVAMMVSGHKTRSVFDRYDIVREEDLRLAAQKQESYQRSLTCAIHDFNKKPNR